MGRFGKINVNSTTTTKNYNNSSRLHRKRASTKYLLHVIL